MVLKSSRLAELLESAEQTELQPTLLPDASVVPAQDRLVVIPRPDTKSLRESSEAALNLRLGTWLMSLRQARTPCLPIHNQPAEAQLTRQHYVPFGKDYFLHPQSFVLGVTLEWINLPTYLAGYVIGKSSWGRRGLIIATATGVHPGFTGCLTLELTNVGELPIAITPGMPICQLFLHQCDMPNTAPSHRSQFAGKRKPTLGSIKPDPLGDQLANSNKTT